MLAITCSSGNPWLLVITLEPTFRVITAFFNVLMYDVFGVNPHNYGFAETTDFKHFENLGRLNEGVMRATNFSSPKHGSIVHLTDAEARALAAYWKFDYESLPAPKN